MLLLFKVVSIIQSFQVMTENPIGMNIVVWGHDWKKNGKKNRKTNFLDIIFWEYGE
jgi:hypothetical protein